MSSPQPEQTRLSESVIWDLHEEFYTQRGQSAWDITPFQPTSNNFIAEACAEQLMAFLQDCAGRLDSSEPLYIVELGSGTGCFAFNFIREFAARQQCFEKLRGVKWTYVLTDIVPKNLDYWKSNGAFDEYIAGGRVDFALFKPEQDASVTLNLSGRVLAPGVLKNPLVVVANYFFDSLRCDEFRVNNGVLEESLVRFDIPAQNRFAFADFTRHTEYRPVSQPYYGHLVFDAILEEYRTQFREASVLFPIASLKTLESLKRFSGVGLFLIACDKGFSYPQYMEGHYEHHYSPHGSFSYMVNYDAIKRYFAKNGGELLCPTDPDLDIMPHIGFMTSVGEPFEWTRYFYEMKMKKQNLANYLGAIMRETAPASPSDPAVIKEFRAAVQLSNFDPATFDRMAPKLFNYLEATPLAPYQTAALVSLLTHVEAGCYPALGSGAPVWLGILYFKLGDFIRCRNAMEWSLSHFGPNTCAYYYLAACCETHFNEPGKALALYNEALKHDPNDGALKDAIRRLENSSR